MTQNVRQQPAQPGPQPLPLLWCWRHPRARHTQGRCVGRTDVPVDPRKAKRLAHRIRQCSRRHGLPRVVWVSPLQRCRAVGCWLARWGWRVQVDARLLELDFGAWDGLPWTQIAWADVLAWQADLLHHAPGGGESLAQLTARVAAFADEARAPPAHAPRCVVTHGGWLNALARLPAGGTALDATAAAAPGPAVDAAAWPSPPPCGALRCWPPAGQLADPADQ